MAVAFSPKVDQELNTLLLLRNNLTVFDYVIVQGSGVQGSVAIDSVQPGTEPLMFEFPNSVMENCLAGTVVDPLADPLKLTKTFRMHNSGSTSITLRIIGLEGGSCDGRGFVISNCNKDITIKPNRSKKIEITFTPDYTLTQVSTTLRLQTSTGNEFLYPLLAILPHQLLAACIALQPRPEWEKTLAWLSVPFWLLVILCLVATVFVQTKFGMRSSSFVSYKSEAKATKGSGEVFDLKKLSKSMDVLSKKVQELGEKSSNQKSESTGQSMKIEVTREPPKPSTDKNTPVSKPKPEPLVTPTTAQEIPTLRHRVVQSKIERKPSSQETITSLQPVPSRSHTAVTSTPKGMSFKIPIAPVTEPSVISPPRTGTDNHTGAREQTQPCTPTTGAPAQLCSSPTKLKRSSEKTIPEKTVSKGEIISKTPTETNPSSPPANGRKSKIVRKLKPLKITPDSSPLPPSGRKELERKVSESSIVSSNSDSASTGTDKSEEVETPSQVVTVVAEVKKPPPPVTKEPNTGQTIHPPDTPESTEVMSPRTELVDKKEPPISTVRMKGKRKPRQQIKKEEKARKKERGRDKEREKEKDTDKTDAKQLVGSFEDSSSSNSTEQLDNDSTPPLEDTVQTKTETNVQCDKTTENELNKLSETTIIDVSPNEGNEIPVLVSPAVPSTAIKTGCTTKTTKQETKETFTDSFSRTPDQAATYGTKKISTGKKPSEKIKSPVVEKITQLVRTIFSNTS
ncbi:transmembrane protein 131-like [Halichondria panicea]|uniref:transmembrane protein 131-like n=1 Tax=Halichondria panicea TaxID=6063 RepID=UPI00312B519F